MKEYEHNPPPATYEELPRCGCERLDCPHCNLTPRPFVYPPPITGQKPPGFMLEQEVITLRQVVKERDATICLLGKTIDYLNATVLEKSREVQHLRSESVAMERELKRLRWLIDLGLERITELARLAKS